MRIRRNTKQPRVAWPPEDSRSGASKSCVPKLELGNENRRGTSPYFLVPKLQLGNARFGSSASQSGGRPVNANPSKYKATTSCMAARRFAKRSFEELRSQAGTWERESTRNEPVFGFVLPSRKLLPDFPTGRVVGVTGIFHRFEKRKPDPRACRQTGIRLYWSPLEELGIATVAEVPRVPGAKVSGESLAAAHSSLNKPSANKVLCHARI